ncbi:Gfo/Idh/MocA family oxidoreductase [Actinomycetospora lutea]|uniref:Gfo/Idh/MocA family protein n=1 Tax=Actinomycetospora lutea TaxID=663604 RepID=UPI0023668DEB|nr:Gfo/Idh/MocA family oxidoreductase [Actinomycetospora lutea]MDD7938003.1 Gfo/Idh/MocA family oxidoreductase [Actinomycetospora lutea]
MSTGQETCGWGVVGLGWVARDYVLPAIAADPAAHLVGVHDRDPAALEGLAPAYPHLDDLLAAPDLDAVYVATPNHAHAPVVAAVAAAGIPVLCEKPLAHDVPSAKEMVAATDGLLAGTAFDQRFHPAHEVIAERIAGGDLGTVTTVRIVYGCWLPPDWHTPAGGRDNWRVDPARAGGGAMIDLAPHGIDLTGRLLGEDLVDLVALTATTVHDYADPTADDTAVLAGRTAGGTLLSHHVSFSTADPLPRRRLEVVGTGAQLVAENTLGQDPGGTLTRIDASTGAAEPVAFDTGAGPFARQLAAFGAAVRGAATWPYPLERDLALHTLLMEASCP